MFTLTVGGVIVHSDFELSVEIAEQYIRQMQARHTNNKLVELTVLADGEFVKCQPKWMPFQRIRRITGYLVGTTERWNDAKRAEEADRVKHGIR